MIGGDFNPRYRAGRQPTPTETRVLRAPPPPPEWMVKPKKPPTPKKKTP